MRKLDLPCPVCEAEALFRRSLSTVNNIRRRHVNNKRERYICQRCMTTFREEQIADYIVENSNQQSAIEW